jgi:hypothetical protein
VYDKYKPLLNGQTAQETEDFLADPDQTLAAFSKRIDQLKRLVDEIAGLHLSVPLNFLCAMCSDINQLLIDKVNEQIQRLVRHVLHKNREMNRE